MRRRRRVLADLDQEIHDHIEIETQNNIERGMSPEEARYAALRKFGNVTRVKEDVRELWSVVWLESLLQDVNYAFRMLRKAPGFTTVAVIALALGIGVNTAVFTAYKVMVARPIQARDATEMVNLALIHETGATDFTFSYPDYEAYRDSVHSFNGLIAFRSEQMRLSTIGSSVTQRTSVAESSMGRLGLLPSGASNAEFASVFVVSENYFKVLGVAALRGLTFDSMSIAELMASRSVLISENYWRKRFAGDPTVLGKTIYLNSAAFTVAGITPHNFVGTHVATPDFWLPLSSAPVVHADADWLRKRENRCCRLFARLAPGVSIEHAQAEMNLVANRLRTLHNPNSESAKPAAILVWPGSPFPLPLRFYRGLTLTILLIMTAAGMVFVVACADVGSLQLARARSRQNELETRFALGASRLRIIRQLLTESVLLGLLAGVLALLLSLALLKVGAVLAAEAVPPEYGTLIFNVTPDIQVFFYIFTISLAAGILFGLAPATESSRSGLYSVRSGTSSIRTRRIQNFLIAAQVALSLALMIAGSTLTRSSINSLKMETGYDSKHVVDLDLQFPEGPKYTLARKLILVQELRTRLAVLPGVAAITSARPPGDDGLRTVAASLDEQKRPAQNVASIHYNYVEANYFKTLGVPLLRGRSFQSQTGQPEQSIIVSESAARQLWPAQNPMGRSMRLGETDEQSHDSGELRADGATYQVIGIARDIRGLELNGSDARQLYLPLPENRLENHPILIRTGSDPAQVRRAVDSVILSIDPDLVATSSTLDEMLRRSPSFIVCSLAAAVASGVGLLGLLPTLMGIYGTVSYVVVLRTREIGIRIAIGAQKGDILGLILGDSAHPVLAGLLVGAFLAVGASYLLRGLLYGINTVDGVSFVGVSLLFLAVALLAAFLPARRASHVEPVIALRHE
jgi:predicted permease